MRTRIGTPSKHILLALIYGVSGVVITLLLVAVWLLNSRTDLAIWHTSELQHQFKADNGVNNFQDYIAKETLLFDEFEQLVYQAGQAKTPQSINRYNHGSLSDPTIWSQNWNRTFEITPNNAEYGVLLLHGMSDSPYAMSNIAQQLPKNAYIVGLRLPGHGSIPAGLLSLEPQDLTAAVRLTVRHMKQQLAGKPLFVVGYSTGAALALNHELINITQHRPTDFTAMSFISPAVGLPPIAVGAKWQSRIGSVLGLDKLQWNSIKMEYDPFKYISFAVNAGDVVYQLAAENQQLLSVLSARQMQRIPPLLTFQSMADATVSSIAVVDGLYAHLNEKHKLVLFDINRTWINQDLVGHDPITQFIPVLTDKKYQFKGVLIENVSPKTRTVQAKPFAFSRGNRAQALDLKWPANVYSLSHVALPFPIDDPLYGGQVADVDHIQIGIATALGEKGIFSVHADDMLRQKWNPFFDYMMTQIQRHHLQATSLSKGGSADPVRL